MKSLLRLVGATILMTVAVAPFAQANNSRLTVLNEVLDPVAGIERIFPLYLSRLGTYYAELYLEPGDVLRQNPIGLTITVSFLRRGKLVISRDLDIQFVPGKNVVTLFFLESPYDLPQRKNLEVVVKFSGVDPQLKYHSEVVRLQLTRKLQIVPFKI